MKSHPNLFLLTSLLDGKDGVNEKTLACTPDSLLVHDVSDLTQYNVDQAFQSKPAKEIDPDVLERLQNDKVRWHVVLGAEQWKDTADWRFQAWFKSIRMQKGGSVHAFLLNDSADTRIWRQADKLYAPKGTLVEADFSNLYSKATTFFDSRAELRSLIESHSPWKLDDPALSHLQSVLK